MTKTIDQAFDSWLSQGGHNGEYNLRAAFEAGVNWRAKTGEPVADLSQLLTRFFQIYETEKHLVKNIKINIECEKSVPDMIALHADQVASIALNTLAESDKHSVQVLNE